MTVTIEAQRIERQKAENERLRAALLKIEGYLERWADEPECGEFYEIARRALEAKPLQCPHGNDLGADEYPSCGCT